MKAVMFIYVEINGRENAKERSLWVVQRPDLEVTAECDPKSEVKGNIKIWSSIYEEEGI